MQLVSFLSSERDTVGGVLRADGSVVDLRQLGYPLSLIHI